jgi:hypothetical protein
MTCYETYSYHGCLITGCLFLLCSCLLQFALFFKKFECYNVVCSFYYCFSDSLSTNRAFVWMFIYYRLHFNAVAYFSHREKAIAAVCVVVLFCLGCILLVLCLRLSVWNKEIFSLRMLWLS